MRWRWALRAFNILLFWKYLLFHTPKKKERKASQKHAIWPALTMKESITRPKKGRKSCRVSLSLWRTSTKWKIVRTKRWLTMNAKPIKTSHLDFGLSSPFLSAEHILLRWRVCSSTLRFYYDAEQPANNYREPDCIYCNFIFFTIISYYLWLQYIFLCRPDDQCARASRCRQLHGFNFTYIEPGCVKLSKFAVWCQTTSPLCCTAAKRNNSNVTSNTLYDGAITHGWEKITNCERDMKLSFYLQQAQQQLQLSGKSH